MEERRKCVKCIILNIDMGNLSHFISWHALVMSQLNFLKADSI